jgi:alkanesulfonate monooxygenase SsuD/methylene tetrahydromethanopterin reductase-like flavin-dependent oxidoreductase (luciferase family)
MANSTSPLHLAIALDGAGWHPAAWREPGARPGELFTPGYWVDLVQQAERGLADFVTIEDGLRLQSDDPPDTLRGLLGLPRPVNRYAAAGAAAMAIRGDR